MDLKTFQEFTQTTALYPKQFADSYLSSGLGAEVGEVLDLYAKYFRGDYTKYPMTQKLSKELGDIMWFISQICNEEGLSLEEILDENVDKLTSRKSRNKIRGAGDDR